METQPDVCFQYQPKLIHKIGYLVLGGVGAPFFAMTVLDKDWSIWLLIFRLPCLFSLLVFFSAFYLGMSAFLNLFARSKEHHIQINSTQLSVPTFGLTGRETIIRLDDIAEISELKDEPGEFRASYHSVNLLPKDSPPH